MKSIHEYPVSFFLSSAFYLACSWRWASTTWLTSAVNFTFCGCFWRVYDLLISEEPKTTLVQVSFPVLKHPFHRVACTTWSDPMDFATCSFPSCNRLTDQFCRTHTSGHFPYCCFTPTAFYSSTLWSVPETRAPHQYPSQTFSCCLDSSVRFICSSMLACLTYSADP